MRLTINNLTFDASIFTPFTLHTMIQGYLKWWKIPVWDSFGGEARICILYWTIIKNRNLHKYFLASSDNSLQSGSLFLKSCSNYAEYQFFCLYKNCRDPCFIFEPIQFSSIQTYWFLTYTDRADLCVYDCFHVVQSLLQDGYLMLGLPAMKTKLRKCFRKKCPSSFENQYFECLKIVERHAISLTVYNFQALTSVDSRLSLSFFKQYWNCHKTPKMFIW